MDFTEHFRGLYADEITEYTKLILGFSEVVGTPSLCKTVNGQSYVFIRAGYVILHIYQDQRCSLCIPGYSSKDPLITVSNLDKHKFEAVLTNGDIVFTPIIFVYHHRDSTEGHCSLLVYRKSGQSYYIFDALPSTNATSTVSARKVQERVIPFFRKTFSLLETSTKLCPSSPFPVKGGCGVFSLWCMEEFIKHPNWAPHPHFVLPAHQILYTYAKTLAQKLLAKGIDITKRR